MGANDGARGNTWDREVADDGEFRRRPTDYHASVRADGSSKFPAEAGRYHLYVSLACPWAHRTLIARKLKGLEAAIGVDVVDPLLGPDGWTFEQGTPGATGDRLGGRRLLRDVYRAADPHFDGRITVPVLWDRKSERIVNNESSEILRMLNGEFQAFASPHYA